MIGAILFIVIVGWFILVADAVWIIDRIVKGWLNLAENKPVPAAPTAGPPATSGT